MLKTSAASGERSGGSVGFCFFTCHERVPLRSQAVVQIAAEGPEANPTHWTEYLPNGTSHTFGKITQLEHQSLWPKRHSRRHKSVYDGNTDLDNREDARVRYHGGSKVTTDIILASIAHRITHDEASLTRVSAIALEDAEGKSTVCLLKFDWHDANPRIFYAPQSPTRLDLKRRVCQ
ncbi:hypothetical protein HGRIS_001533 [Hohenbuehelia grisea]|uniref:Uncharacterized protein n=1 Tax=Hohenbuehelia grisea TaxID=104357 RepID=A0ABR3JPL4_9AGAR